MEIKLNKIFIIGLSLLVFAVLLSKSVFAQSAVLENISKASLSATSMAICATAGTPIAVVRKTSSQYSECVKEFKKDSISYKFWGFLYSAPVAAVAGPVKGTICGIKSAVRFSVDKPFSKEAFSLGNLEEMPKAMPNTNLQSTPDKPETQPWGTPK